MSRNSIALSTEDLAKDSKSEEISCPDNCGSPVSAPTEQSGFTKVSISEASEMEHTVTAEIGHDIEGVTHSHDTQTFKGKHCDSLSDECSNQVKAENNQVLAKDNYEFILFKQAINDEKDSIIHANSIDGHIYQYHYGVHRVGPVCVMLKSLSVENLEAGQLFYNHDDILRHNKHPWHDYLVSLHEFAKLDFDMGQITDV